MPDMCDIHLRVRGPAADLEEFTAGVLKDTEPMPGDSPFRDQFIFTLRTETWGEMGEEQTFLWVKGIEYYKCDTILGSERPSCDELVLLAEAKWHPPTAFVDRAMQKYPTLDFDLRGVTECVVYEHWSSIPPQGRHLFCWEERHVDLAADRIIYLRIKGQEILDERGRSLEARDTNWQGEGF